MEARAAARPFIEACLASPDAEVRADVFNVLSPLYLPRDEEMLFWVRRFHYGDPEFHRAHALIDARLKITDFEVVRAVEENLPYFDRAILLAPFS